MSIDRAVFARLREIADQLPQVPGIGKVEIAEGEIVMTTSPVSRHELAVLRIARQLNAQLPNTHPGYVAHGGADLEDAGLGRLRNPDLMVFREKALDVGKPALLPHEVLLVVEIVSKSDPENDHHHKHRARRARVHLPHGVRLRRHRHRRALDPGHRGPAHLRLTGRNGPPTGVTTVRLRARGPHGFR
ncbi:Uma2 family endonuclease [Kitasatospora herbaricolor]|uniref:Uma2 family endonuclease n=1 Tax=Kitasatospora herbaricolor TaxID=68217 RepID=UPI0036D7DEDF